MLTMGRWYRCSSNFLAFSARLPSMKIWCSTSWRSAMIAMKVFLLLVAVSTTAVRKKRSQCSRSLELRTTVRAS
ncbi:hypothetical protein D9M69_653850 [compost metagenome]